MRAPDVSFELVSRSGVYAVFSVDGDGVPRVGSKVSVKKPVFSGKVVDVIGRVDGPYVVVRSDSR